jgi:hypothetical protein
MCEKKITFFCLLYGAIAISACSRISDLPAVLAALYARYDDVSHLLKAEASFKKGDTLATARPLAIQGGVTFANSAMQLKNLPGSIRYDYELDSGALPSELAFRLKDENGKAYNFPVAIEPVTDFSFQDTAVSQKETLKIQVKTVALTKDSKLVVLLSNEKNESFSMEYKGHTPNPTIEIPAAHLQSLSPGKLQIALVRSDFFTGKEGRFLYTAAAEFYSATKFIWLTE